MGMPVPRNFMGMFARDPAYFTCGGRVGGRGGERARAASTSGCSRAMITHGRLAAGGHVPGRPGRASLRFLAARPDWCGGVSEVT